MSAITVAPEAESVKTRLKNIWMAGDYDRFSRYMESGARDFYERLLVVPGYRLLDVGCGSGQLALIAAKDGLEVTGVEADAEALPFEHRGYGCFTRTLNPERDRISMEGIMNKILESMAVLVLALVGLVGCDYEPRAVGDANPVRVAEMRQTFRDLWLGHIFWVQHVVSNIVTKDPAERDAAEKEVLANTKQIASTIAPFYGEVASEKLYSLLDVNIDTVREYSEATVAGNKQQQDAALARLASNADDIADFLSQVNSYLQKDTVRSLIAAHGAHHVLQINQYKAKDYAHLAATWPMMRQHVYVIADTLTMALVKQFPNKFS